MSIWMESNVYTKSSISRSCHDLSFSQGLFTRIMSTRPSIMRPRLMSFGGGEHHLSVFSSYIFLQHVSAFSVSSAHILAYQSQRSAKSPLKWSHRIWQLCEWNKDFLCVFTCHRVSPGLSEQKKKEECSLFQKCQNVWKAIPNEWQSNGWGQRGPSVKCWTKS